MMSDRDYEVGYRKPPKHTQFQKGRSGNPKGKRKRRATTAELVELELDRPITITENGRTMKILKREALAKQVVQMAIKGDARIIKYFLSAPSPTEEEMAEEMTFTLQLEEDDPGMD